MFFIKYLRQILFKDSYIKDKINLMKLLELIIHEYNINNDIINDIKK